MEKKKGQMEFAWIFAVIVGAMILFLTFYFVGTKLLSQKQEQATIQAHGLDILLNPFAQFGSLKAITSDTITMPQTSKIDITCDASGSMGSNTILLTAKGQAGVPRVLYDKYIFTENLEAKNLQVLAAPFEMPWRVADTIILWPKDKSYCFVKAPQQTKDLLGNETVNGLNISDIQFTNSVSLCQKDSTTVCFDTTGCQITVTNAMAGYGSTKKQGKTVYFASNALMYASIFSDTALYNCNFKRLMLRLYSETSIFEEKAKAMQARGCETAFSIPALRSAADAIIKASVITESQVNNLWLASQELNSQNSYASCSLF